MEETGILENHTLLTLVLPDFEPGLIIVTNQTQFTRGALSGEDSDGCLVGGERPVARRGEGGRN